MLIQRSENILRKLPILFVYVKEVTRLGDNATLVLSDGNESIKGTLASDIYKQNRAFFNPGTVLLLKDVIFLIEYFYRLNSMDNP